ncbi:MAG: GntR family transcriptional regulator [Lachnospiraceae bacterium]|nr:GntR family transcriptional regulator [Lachnospiraceae bacterium]
MGEFELNMDDYLPLRDVVFQTLRKAILTGELMPGERLMEIHLAEKLGVSRTPIREAIRKLELEGLVMNIPRRGAQVAEISERGLRDVLEVRRALDTFCAELACERISDEEKEALKKACKDFEDAVETKDVTVIAKADVAFHDIIVGATGNERLVALLNNLAEQMYRYRFEYIKDFSQHGKLIEEHRVLMDAILKGNIIGARDAAREHIDNQEKSILMQISIDANGQAKE